MASNNTESEIRAIKVRLDALEARLFRRETARHDLMKPLAAIHDYLRMKFPVSMLR